MGGSFTDPGTLDTHTVSINWGDGSALQTVDLDAGVLSFSGISHQYLDNPTGQPTGGSYSISVTVADKDGDVSAANTIGVEVDNVTPGTPGLNLTSTTISENGTTALGGSFTDPGTLDTHTVSINWGDGSAIQTVDLDAGVLSFSGISHQYLDNPAGQPTGGSYSISVTVADKDGATSAANTIGVEVDNVAPGTPGLNLTSTTISENGSTALGGSFTDPGTLDTHTVSINWGDGSAIQTVNLDAGILSFSGISHQYLDNPTGQPTGSYSISVTVADKDGEVSAANTIGVEVDNVTPGTPGLNLTSTTISENGSTALGGSFTDPGTLDTHTVSINWGDGSAIQTVHLDAGVLSFSAAATSTWTTPPASRPAVLDQRDRGRQGRRGQAPPTRSAWKWTT